jgi:hypothetical protein
MRGSFWLFTVLSLTASMVVLSGCGSESTSSGVKVVAGIRGNVHGGQQPVSNSTVRLYTVGTAGDGSTATPMLTQTVTSDANGNFSITGLYSCTTASYVYFTATGGNPGLPSANPDIALMNAFGLCSSLNSGTFVVINELSSVAAVSALAPFMSSPSSIGSGSSDASSLASAFSLASALVNPLTGLSPGSNVPTGLAVPTSLINTLGNVIAACINSSGGTAGDSTACGQLLALTTPANTTPPTDTLSALLNLANNPSLNTASLFGLASPSAPFQPQLSSAPSDFHVSLMPQGGASLALQASPSSVSFANTAVGFSSAQQIVTLENSGTTAVSLDGISVVGINAAEFSETNTCGSSLAPNATCTIQVTATPSAMGARSASLSIVSNATNSPLSVPLTVSGTAAMAGPASLGAAGLSFSITGLTKDITLSNSGNIPLTIRSITSSDPNFAVTSNCGTMLPAMSICTISVQANGQSTELNSTFTTFSGVLTVADDAAAGSQTATLFSQSQERVTNGIDFGSWAIGTTRTSTLTFSPASYYYPINYVQGTIDGPNASDFSFTLCSIPIQNGQSCAVPVTFIPSATGPRVAKYDMGSAGYIPLTGVGLALGPSFTLTEGSFFNLDTDLNANNVASSSAQFMITNNGSTTLNFPSFPVTGPNAANFATTNTCLSLAPQGMCNVTVNLNASAIGTYQATMTVTDSISSTIHALSLSAFVSYPLAGISPSYLSFGPQALGTASAPQSFTVTNGNRGGPIGHPLSVTLPASSNFTLPGGSSCPASTTQVCTLTVAFQPNVTGNINQLLTVTDLTSGNSSNLDLLGVGGTGVVSLSTNSITFPGRSVGTTSVPMTVTLTNTGVAVLTVNAVSLTGTVNGNYTATNNCSSVAVHGSCTINVTFAPSVAGTQGAMIQILSNAQSSPDTISISGSAN